MTGRIEKTTDHAGLMARTLVMEDGSRWVEEHTVAELKEIQKDGVRYMAGNDIQIKVSPEMRELVDRLEKMDIGALLRERDELKAKLAAIRGAWDRAAEEGATVDLTPGMQCLIDLIKGGPR